MVRTSPTASPFSLVTTFKLFQIFVSELHFEFSVICSSLPSRLLYKDNHGPCSSSSYFQVFFQASHPNVSSIRIRKTKLLRTVRMRAGVTCYIMKTAIFKIEPWFLLTFNGLRWHCIVHSTERIIDCVEYAPSSSWFVSGTQQPK